MKFRYGVTLENGENYLDKYKGKTMLVSIQPQVWTSPQFEALQNFMTSLKTMIL